MEKNVDDAQKAILKMWDHVMLARQQYTMLKQSDAEYKKKFDGLFELASAKYKEEMNAQMITMVSIFTALAFLLFGSISSLDGVFENIQFPLFKVMSIGIVWGLGVSNTIFVFLYCVGKMTNLGFLGKPPDQNINVFKRYAIIWWTNFCMIALLVVSLWGWFIQSTAIGTSILLDLKNESAWGIFVTGSIVIFVVIVHVAAVLCKKIEGSNGGKQNVAKDRANE